MDCVSRVVFKNHNYAVKEDREFFNIALQFMFLDERDRDAIVSHISRLQLVRIAQSRQKSLLSGRDDSRDRQDRFRFVRMAAVALLVISFFAFVTIYFMGYASHHDKNDIQKSFEESINTILRKLR
jgi:hypothetical protein